MKRFDFIVIHEMRGSKRYCKISTRIHISTFGRIKLSGIVVLVFSVRVT